MAEPLFDGTLSKDDRLELVARMFGYAGAHDAPREFMERMLRNAERAAYGWLLREIEQCAAGEAARRASRRCT